jgi:hypothetical protein
MDGLLVLRFKLLINFGAGQELINTFFSDHISSESNQ